MPFGQSLNGYGHALEEKVRFRNAERKAESYRMYNMAKLTNLTADWNTFASTYNYDIRTAGAKMVARARSLAQNDPYSKKILRLLEKNVVGPMGFLFRNKSGEYQRDDKLGEMRFVYDKLANLIIENAWWDWSQKKYCTVDGQVSFRRLSQLAIRNTWMDGEVLFKLIRGRVNKYGFALQPIDPLFLDHTLNSRIKNGNIIMMGIELDAYRKPIAYWLRKTPPTYHPSALEYTSNEYDRVIADDIIHLFIQEVPGQVRGITQFAPTGLRSQMLYQFEESSLMRSKYSARVPGVISQIPNQNPLDGPGIEVQKQDDDGNWLFEMEDGQYLKVKNGFQLNALESEYPHQLHTPFTKINLRGISSGNDVGYSSVSGDYENVTWHSGKLEKNDERDGYRDLQQMLIEDFLNPVNYEWLSMAMLSGAVNLPLGKLQKFYQPTFIGRGWEYTNPKEETDADISGLDAGINTLESVLAKRGIDIDEHFDQLAREAEKRKEWKEKYGVSFNWGKTQAPKEQPAQPENNTVASGKNGKAHPKVYSELFKEQ